MRTQVAVRNPGMLLQERKIHLIASDQGREGLLMSVLCADAVASSWFNPFPLLQDSQGGYSNIRNSILFDVGLFASLLTIALAIFGRGIARLLLAGSGFLLVVMAYGSLLSNGV
jgi:hypothetical protein